MSREVPMPQRSREPGANPDSPAPSYPDPTSRAPLSVDLDDRQQQLDRQRAALEKVRAELEATASRLEREQSVVDQLRAGRQTNASAETIAGQPTPQLLGLQ